MYRLLLLISDITAITAWALYSSSLGNKTESCLGLLEWFAIIAWSTGILLACKIEIMKAMQCHKCKICCENSRDQPNSSASIWICPEPHKNFCAVPIMFRCKLYMQSATTESQICEFLSFCTMASWSHYSLSKLLLWNAGTLWIIHTAQNSGNFSLHSVLRRFT